MEFLLWSFKHFTLLDIERETFSNFIYVCICNDAVSKYAHKTMFNNQCFVSKNGCSAMFRPFLTKINAKIPTKPPVKGCCLF